MAHNIAVIAIAAAFASTVFAVPAMAQATAPSSSAPVAFPLSSASQPASQPAADRLPPEELEKLLAPIALYPDVLLAQILPASTFPMDIVMAARWLRSNPDKSKLTDQPWDLSVLALCNYPDVIYMLDKDLDWTNALGATFLSQQEDVMNTIQDLRRQAQASGALQTTPQQTVMQEAQTIRIVPTQQEVVYVPQYDSQVVYAAPPAQTVYVEQPGVSAGAAVAASAISFGAGMALGAWLDHDCDWDDGYVAWCRPGYWGGWGHVGSVDWDDDWAAFAGSRRAGIVGEEGGAYIGPRGAAVWGDDGHGAAWRRPTAYGGPAYTGRYASYNRVGARNTQVNRSRVTAGNQVNINRNTVNVDRGDRTSIAMGGDRTTIGGGGRTNIGGDRTRVQGGDRTNVRGDRTSAFDSGNRASKVQQDSRRGSSSRSQAGAKVQPARQKAQVSPQKAGKSKPSSFSDTRSHKQVKQSSNRGSASRGGAAHRGGGGGRGGGGRRGR